MNKTKEVVGGWLDLCLGRKGGKINPAGRLEPQPSVSEAKATASPSSRGTDFPAYLSAWRPAAILLHVSALLDRAETRRHVLVQQLQKLLGDPRSRQRRPERSVHVDR